MARDSFVFYRSFAEALIELEPEDFKEAVIAMCEFAMDDKDPEVKGMAKAIFSIAKPILANNNKRYENGKKGGRPKTEPKPNRNQTETKPKPNTNQTVTNVKEQEQDNVNINPKERKTSKREIEVIPAYAEDPVLNAAICEFIDFRKQIKAPMSDIALTKMLSKLEKIGKSDHERIEILNESMANGWKGIFPLDKPRKHEIDWETL